MAQRSGAIDMTKGSPVKLMARFAIPMMIGSVFQSLYTMVDSAVLGRYCGSEALAAIGAASTTVSFLLMLATSVTSAVSIVMSQYVGSHDSKKIKAGLVSAVYLTVGLGVVLGLLGFFMARPMMELLGTPKNIIDMSVKYIKYIGGLCICTFAYNAVSSVLRALGDSKTPLIFLIVCSILNVILDLGAVIGLGMDVDGVAVATLLSQAISAVACIFYMFRKYPELKLSRADILPNMKVTGKIFGMGAQMALQSAMLSIGMMVITRIINSYGSDVVAAFTVGSNVQNLAVMLFSNFSFGFSVYIGQNYGAKDAGRIRKGLKQMLLLVGAISTFSAILCIIFADFLVSIYVKSDELAVIEASLSFVRIQSCFFPFLGWIWLYLSTLKGMGKIAITTVSSFVELGSKIGFSIVLPILLSSYIGIWFAAPLGWILGIIPNAIYYYSGKWEKELKK